MSDIELRTLLARAADAGGPFPAPPAALILAGARRRSRVRLIAAVTSVVVLVAGLAVALSVRGPNRTPAPQHRFDASLLPGPTGPVVTASQLATYHWDRLPAAPIAGRDEAAAVWTGSRLLIWGGTDGIHTLGDGASYDPQTRQWTRLPVSPLGPRYNSAYAWVGGELVIWGGLTGTSNPTALTDGARFDPATSTWSLLPAAPVAYSDIGTTGVAVGSEFAVIVNSGRSDAFDVAEYDVEHDAWHRLPTLIAPHGGAWSATAVSAGTSLLVWLSEWLHVPDRAVSVALQDGVWVPTPYDKVRPTSAFWTGQSIVVPSQQATCEMCPEPFDLPGSVLDPQSGRPTTRIATGDRATRNVAYAWTGGGVLAVRTDSPFRPALVGTTEVWDVEANRWTSLPSTPLRHISGIIWTGNRLLVLPSPGSTGGAEFAP